MDHPENQAQKPLARNTGIYLHAYITYIALLTFSALPPKIPKYRAFRAWLENCFRWCFWLWLMRSAAHYFVMSAKSTSFSYLSSPSFSQHYVPCLDILWGLPFTAELLVSSSGIWKKCTRLKGRLPKQSRYIYRQHICLFKILAGKTKLQAQASQAIIISA